MEDLNRRKFEEFLLITTGRKIADFPITPEELIANQGLVVRRVEAYRPTIGNVKRKEVPEYQPQAVREFITNAAVHRDYSISGPARSG